MIFSIDRREYNFKKLYYYDGLKLGYDLFNSALILWQDKDEKKQEFAIVEVPEFDVLMLFLLNEYKLKNLIDESDFFKINIYYDGKIEKVEDEDIIMPTNNSYLGFSILDNFEEPSGGKLSKKSIVTVSNRLREILKKDLNDIYDLELTRVIKKLKGRLHYVNFDLWNKTEEGSILIYDKEDFDIFVPDFGGVTANRFTIAHEIGHYILHGLLEEKKMLKAARYGDSMAETEATVFALNLLIPNNELEDIKIAPEELSKKYFVPVENIIFYRETNL